IGDLRRQHANFVTELPQQRSKQTVELVAKPAAVSLHDFFEQRRVFQNDRFAGVNAQILERHGPQMRDVKLPKRLDSAIQRAEILDSIQISRKVHFLTALQLDY